MNEHALLGLAVPIEHTSILSALHEVASSDPARIAVEDADQSIDYGDLWKRGQVVAQVLAEMGVEKGDRVALWAERSAATLVAAVGVMALGAAYVPLDPHSPPGRVEAVIAASGVEMLLHSASSSIAVPTLRGVSAHDIGSLSSQGGMAPRLRLPDSSDAAYVIFTSGSTGSPKGVVVEHRSLINYSSWCARLTGGVGASPLFGSLGFDHVLTSLWPTLVRGGTLVVCQGVWDQARLFGHRSEPYSLAKVTPSHLKFFERVGRPEYARFTRLLVSGGEVLDTALLRGIADRLDGVRLVNHYGPSETTIGCCYFPFDIHSLPDGATVPIGRPIWNTRAYVVDEGLRPVLPGTVGQLVIGGAGVARGYLNPADAEGRFVAEAEFSDHVGSAYLTGDLVELRGDGNLMFHGRADDQVKVSGYRIELEGMRARALSVSGVVDVAFEKRASAGGEVLEAFVVPAPDVDAAAVGERIRHVLSGDLPASAVPQRYHLVPEFSVTTNGKRDLAATRARWCADGSERS